METRIINITSITPTIKDVKLHNKRRRKTDVVIADRPINKILNDICVSKANEGQFEMSMIDKSQVVKIVQKEIVVNFN